MNMRQLPLKKTFFIVLCSLTAWCAVANLIVCLLGSVNFKQAVVWMLRISSLYGRSQNERNISPDKDSNRIFDLTIEDIEEVFGLHGCGNRSIPVLLEGNVQAADLWSQDLPFGFKDVPVDDVVKTIKRFRPADSRWFTSSSDNSTCNRSCIVIGNGGLLLDQELGPQIDTYDIVIRFNEAPTVGYEKHVGTKTNFRILYPQSSRLRDFGKENANNTVYYIMTVQSDTTWPWLDAVWEDHDVPEDVTFWRQPGDPHQYHKLLGQIYIMHPAVFRKAREMLQLTKRPTTGLVGILFASQICDSIDIAGFSFNKDEHGSLHYYESAPMEPMVCEARQDHDIEAEVNFLWMLTDFGFVVDLTDGVEEALESWSDEESEACRQWKEAKQRVRQTGLAFAR